MTESINVKLPNPEPIQFWLSRERDLETGFEAKMIPKNGKDIARVVLEAETERELNGDTLSDEALFTERLDTELEQYCAKNSIKPALTVAQLAHIVDTQDVPKDFPLTSEKIRHFYESLVQRYNLTPEAVTVEGPKQKRTIERAKTEAHETLQNAVRGFWTRLYIAILKKESAETLPERLRMRLVNLSNESDPETRSARLQSLVTQTARFPASKIPLFVSALYEVMYGTMKGKVFTVEEKNKLYGRLADAAEVVRPASEAGDYTRPKLEQAVLELNARSDSGGKKPIDRTTPGGLSKAARRTEKILTAYDAVTQEPFLLLAQTSDFFSGEKIAAKLASFSPLQQRLFSIALNEKLARSELTPDLQRDAEQLMKPYTQALDTKASLASWGAQCADLLNDVMTLPVKVEIAEPSPAEALQDIMEADEQGEVEPVREQPAAEKAQEKVTVESVLSLLRQGGKSFDMKRIVRTILSELKVEQRSVLFESLAPLAVEGKIIPDVEKRVGLSFKTTEREALRTFLAEKGMSTSKTGKFGWTVLITIARKNRSFRNL